ncbi:hypothetical protein TUMSATVNIG1_08620 [Vibrio nigripulchritudo]|uniref:phosphopantetheine-binding protein n=1 Tax=Vibrio nigripulchritudo TaxID=28173 RepID=UPI001909C8CD|nr:phosphopantetheine-binding protein [Vibrio nigripulchritudo]BCL68922.1 hypothetical protein VNTUMSATTG_08590 [Vibrio nigripulchritudo]BDU30253.1 hypothetical protein TUMSATVNIG1_08620 [Vibrio nigripulchritudo]
MKVENFINTYISNLVAPGTQVVENDAFFDYVDSFSFIDLITNVESEFGFAVDLMTVDFDLNATIRQVLDWFNLHDR